MLAAAVTIATWVLGLRPRLEAETAGLKCRLGSGLVVVEHEESLPQTAGKIVAGNLVRDLKEKIPMMENHLNGKLNFDSHKTN